MSLPPPSSSNLLIGPQFRFQVSFMECMSLRKDTTSSTPTALCLIAEGRRGTGCLGRVKSSAATAQIRAERPHKQKDPTKTSGSSNRPCLGSWNQHVISSCLCGLVGLDRFLIRLWDLLGLQSLEAGTPAWLA